MILDSQTPNYQRIYNFATACGNFTSISIWETGFFPNIIGRSKFVKKGNVQFMHIANTNSVVRNFRTTANMNHFVKIKTPTTN